MNRLTNLHHNMQIVFMSTLKLVLVSAPQKKLPQLNNIVDFYCLLQEIVNMRQYNKHLLEQLQVKDQIIEQSKMVRHISYTMDDHAFVWNAIQCFTLKIKDLKCWRFRSSIIKIRK